MGMEYLRGYRVFRQDPEWASKLLVGSLLFLSAMVIPLLGQVVLVGWQALILRRAAHGQQAPMPRLELDFDYLGKLAGTGFKGLIVRLVWVMPVVLLFGALTFCVAMGIPVAVAAGAAAGDGDEGMALGAACCVGSILPIMLPVLVLAQIPASVAAMRTELTDDLNAGLAFKEVLAFCRAMKGPLLRGSLVLWLVGTAAGLLGMLLCYVGVFPVAVLGLVVQAHFTAQVYRAWVVQGGAPLPIAPVDVPARAPPAPPPQLPGNAPRA